MQVETFVAVGAVKRARIVVAFRHPSSGHQQSALHSKNEANRDGYYLERILT